MKTLVAVLALSFSVPALAAPSLNDVMQSRHIGKPLSSLGLGKPIQSGPIQEIFLVGSCPVEVMLRPKTKTIKSITAADLSKCPGMKLEEYFGADSPALPTRVTFGQFNALLANKEVHYWADCLMLCGNGYEPLMHASWMPSTLEGLSASSPMVDDASINASDKWEAEMKKKYGEDYVIDTKFNCTPEFDAKAQAFLKDVRVTSITIGQPGFVFECARG